MKLLQNEEIPIPAWRELLNRSSYSSPFQTPEWYEFFNSVDGLSADVIAVKCNASLSALVVVTLQKESGITSFFSRRAIIYGGPLFVKNDLIGLESLLVGLKSYYKKRAIYVEIRNLFDFKNCLSVFNRAGLSYNAWLNFQIDTSDLQVVKQAISKSRLRQINKAIKSGVLWREARSVEEITVFYNILKRLYQNRVKKPLFPLSFFYDFFHRGVGKYLLVYFKEEIIGGIMCVIMPNKIVYEYYICGLDKEYKDQYPSAMATWAAIEYANQNGISQFDFMGAGSPDDEYGVREFKARFGGRLIEYGRFLLVLNPFLYKIGKLAIRIKSKF